MTSLSANFTQGQATFAFRDVIDHCVSRQGSSSYAINWIQESCVFKNQTLKLKREINSRHFDVTELALRARLQERFPKGTRNQSERMKLTDMPLSALQVLKFFQISCSSIHVTLIPHIVFSH